jgi:peptidoglycan/LPS O-acetylase OafA/YrhL
VAIPPRLAGAFGLAAAGTLAWLQYLGPFSLASLALICVLIVAAAAIPVSRPSRLVERAALVSFSIFITNEVVRIAYFGVANVVIARLGLPEPLQWALWAGGLVAALAFAFLFYRLFDAPTQAWLAEAMKRGWWLDGLARRLRERLPRPMYDQPSRSPRPEPGGFELPVRKGPLTY